MLGPTSFTAIKLTQDKQVRRNTNTPPPALPCSGLVKKPVTFVLPILNRCLEVTWETSPLEMRPTEKKN